MLRTAMNLLPCKIRVFSLVALSAIAVAGCCKHHHCDQVAMTRGSNAIFNPPGSPVALADFDRADWPVAYVAESTSEDIQYHEQIIDVQGRGFGRDDGFLLRRFESDRFGRIRR
jgi:hypothetical protein